MAHVLLDQFHYHAPTSLVRREGLRPARERNSIEAGLGYGQHDAIRHFVQPEDHQRRRLGGVVDAALNGEWMPSEGE